jgi:hypothetical protein
MRHIASILSVLGLLFSASSATAGAYLHPRAGAFIPIDGGSTSYSFGGSLGYQFTSMLAVEAEYSRVFARGNAGAGDIIVGRGIVTIPFPFINPYASAGVGTLHTSAAGNSTWKTMVPIGAGVTIGPLLFLNVGIGVNYDIVLDGPDYLEPGISLGINF